MITVCGAAVGASGAYAAYPMSLTGGTASSNAEIVGSGGKGTMQTVSGKRLTCTGVTSTAKLVTETTGTYAAVFSGCAAVGVKCTGLSNTTAGEITVSGEARLVYDNESALGLGLTDPFESLALQLQRKITCLDRLRVGVSETDQ
jgi:hypothetical protein